jgi:hypothetical protein
MFEGKTFLEILQIGGFTMYILLFCSLLSVTIFLKGSSITENDLRPKDSRNGPIGRLSLQ